MDIVFKLIFNYKMCDMCYGDQSDGDQSDKDNDEMIKRYV